MRDLAWTSSVSISIQICLRSCPFWLGLHPPSRWAPKYEKSGLGQCRVHFNTDSLTKLHFLALSASLPKSGPQNTRNLAWIKFRVHFDTNLFTKLYFLAWSASPPKVGPPNTRNLAWTNAVSIANLFTNIPLFGLACLSPPRWGPKW